MPAEPERGLSAVRAQLSQRRSLRVDRAGHAQCDDGNVASGDGCRANCTLEICGDGLLDAGEQCDDGNDGCDSACRFEGCGDGVTVIGEECDDGNRRSGDGCDSSCFLEGGILL